MNFESVFPEDFSAHDDVQAIIREHWLVMNYTVNSDKSVNVIGDLSFPEFASFLKELPLNFNIVSGDFDCSLLKNLTTLKGAPVEVGGTFNCSYTSINSLEFAPKKAKHLIFDNSVESIVNGNTTCIYKHVTIISRTSNSISRQIDKLVQNTEYLPIIFKYLPFFLLNDDHSFNDQGLDILIEEVKDGLK